MHDEIISSIKNERELHILLDDTFKLIDVLNISTTLCDLHKYLHVVFENSQKENANFEIEVTQKYIELVISRYFSYTSPILVYLENEMLHRHLHVKYINKLILF